MNEKINLDLDQKTDEELRGFLGGHHVKEKESNCFDGTKLEHR